MHFAKGMVAVHWWWLTAHLHYQQIFKGVFAVTRACCEPVLQSSTGQWGMHFALSSAAVPWCWVTAHLYEEPAVSLFLNSDKPAATLFCRAALSSGECVLP